MRVRTIGSMILSMMALWMLVAICGGTQAFGQRFQYTYGSKYNEAGRGGVRPVYSEGGYIAVGETFSPSDGNTADIYLVRSNGDGSLAWSNTYNIGGNDSATDIEEVLNDDGSLNGYIITGVTDNIDPYGCGRNRDVFLLRIDPCGKPVWTNTYGTPESEEIGYDVHVMKVEDGCGGKVGDFVVAGSTCLPDAKRDGYLIRVHDGAPANLVWTRRFNSPCDGDDYWYGLTEALTGVDDGQKGDIILVGGSDGFCEPGIGGYDCVIAHLDPCGKYPGVFPYGYGVYGNKNNDDLRSVIEITEGEYAGTIVATGRTEVTNDAGVVNPAVYVIQTRSWPCRRVADLTLGDKGEHAHEGYWVREVKAPHPDAGNVVITGYMTLANGLGDKDVFLQRITPGTLTPVAPTTFVYGGEKEDWGWSVFPVDNTKDNCYSPGYVIAGFTWSFGNQQELYLIKTDLNPKSGCHESDPQADEDHPNYEEHCLDMRLDEWGTECQPRIEVRCWDWQQLLCSENDGNETCFAPRCECPEGVFKMNLTPGGNRISMAGTVGTFPNPIKNGSLLNLEYTLAREGQAAVIVSDMAGKVVYSHAEIGSAGVNRLPVSINGWANGAYMVKVTAGGKSMTSQFVVADK